MIYIIQVLEKKWKKARRVHLIQQHTEAALCRAGMSENSLRTDT
jgi:CDGSH-type Zn-finger protein